MYEQKQTSSGVKQNLKKHKLHIRILKNPATAAIYHTQWQFSSTKRFAFKVAKALAAGGCCLSKPMDWKSPTKSQLLDESIYCRLNPMAILGITQKLVSKTCVLQNAEVFSIHSLSDQHLPPWIQGTWPALPTRGMEKFQPLSSPRKAETSSSFGRVLR